MRLWRFDSGCNIWGYSAMFSKLDESVGSVVEALEARDMLNNSIIVFTTDNGGAAAGFNLNAASNYPLKGVKNTIWEGGVKGAACVWSPLIKKPSRISTQLMQIADWLPTLLEAAGGDTRHPDILAKLQHRLQEINGTAVPPGNLPLDARGDPKYWNYVFTNFGDYEDPTISLIEK